MIDRIGKWSVWKTTVIVLAALVLLFFFAFTFVKLFETHCRLNRGEQRLTKLERTRTTREKELVAELAKYKQLGFKDYKQIIGFMTSAYRDLDERMNTFVKVKDYPKLPNHLVRLQYAIDDLQVLKYQIAMLAQFVHQLHDCENNKFGLCKTVDGAQMWEWQDHITLGQLRNGMEAKIAREARDKANEECEKEKRGLRFVVKKLRKDVHEMERSMQ